MKASEYNYEHFDLPLESKVLEDFPAWPLGPGQRAPNAELPDMTGELVKLSALWKKGPAIIEFGSFT